MHRVRRVDAALLGGVLVLAAALRLPGLRYGLPLPLLNPDEESIVPRAWAMVHGGGLDPGWYDYPSLLMLVLAPTQVLADAPSYGAARAFALLIGLAGVASAWWLGWEAFGRWSAVVGASFVAVATTHVAYSQMAVTDGLLVVGTTSCLALLVGGRIEWAGLALGLAASAKYPGVLLAVPLLVAGWGHWRRVAWAAGIAVGAFVLTSPFVLIHGGRAWEDVRRVQSLARLGWLGFEDDPVTPLAFAERLWGAVGPDALLALVAVVALTAIRRTRADVVLGSFALAYWVWLLPLQAHFDRYVLPLVPVLGVVLGSVSLVVPVVLALLVVPLAWSIGDQRGHRGEDARLRANAWIAANVPLEDPIAADPSTLPLPGRDPVRLALPGPGRPDDPRRDVGALERAGVRWVLVTGAVADRVSSHADRYPRAAAFYETLDRDAKRVFEASGDDPGLAGPWVRVYRLPEG